MNMASTVSPTWKKCYRLADQLRRRGRIREALQMVTGLLARDERHVQALLLKGKCLLDIERYPDAIGVYQYLHQLFPSRSEPVYCLAFALDRMERTSEAVEMIESFTRRRQDVAAAHRLLGRYRIKLGEWQRALVDLARAVRLDRSDIRGWKDLAQGLEKLGHRESALDAWKKVQHMDPNSTGALAGVRRLAALLGRHRLAATAGWKMVGLGVDAPSFVETVIKDCLRAGQRDTALSLLEDAIGSGGATARTWILKGALHESLGEIKEARIAYHHVVELHPDCLTAVRALARLARSQADRPGERVYLARLALLEPHAPDALHRLAELDAEEGRLEDAVKGFRKVLLLDPADREVLLQLGLVYHRLGRYSQAEESLRSFVQESPDHPRALLGLAHVLRGKGERYEARKLFERVHQVAPETREGRIALYELNVLAGRFQPSRPVLRVGRR